MSSRLSRRRFLRGALSTGAVVTVGLPLLEVFLNDHGDALASGSPLPVRFGTWFWGCGMNPHRWDPEAVGTDFELPPELEPIADIRDDVSILSGYSVFLEREPNYVHYSGFIGTLTGEPPTPARDAELPTLDVLVSDAIGGTTRFRSLEMAAPGSAKRSLSQRHRNIRNLSEPTALSLYQRVFGSGFSDPNQADWSPDPSIVPRQSALSIVAEDRRRLEAGLGAADRARLDAYFTSLRQLEKQLELQLTRPPALEACRVPEAPVDSTPTFDVSTVVENHRLMAQVLALALACDQTRVFNMLFSAPASMLHKPGSHRGHHALTHDEPFDKELGYQVQATEFVMISMEAWATFVETLRSIQEGDGTLLDNCLVLAHSDCSNANTHSVENLPIMLAGKAGGRVRTGLHVRGEGEASTRVSLTVQQAMGMPAERFGTGRNEVDRPVSEVLV